MYGILTLLSVCTPLMQNASVISDNHVTHWP